MAEGYKALTYDDVEQLIIDGTPLLNKRLKMTPNLTAALRKAEVIDDDTVDELAANILTPIEKKMKLMETIKQKGEEAFLNFCHILNDKDTKQGHLVKQVFKLRIEDIEQQRATYAPEGVTADSAPPPSAAPPAAAPAASPAAAPAAVPAAPSAPPRGPATADAAPSAPAEPADDEPFIKTPIKYVTKEVADGILQDRKRNYPMRSQPRGRCIILSNDNFGSMQMDRRGSDKDLVNLNMLFTELGFTVVSWSNLTAKDITARIVEEQKLEEHKQHDAFVMCVLSHGTKGNIQDVKSKNMNIMEELVEPFNAANAPGLANKPKLFFIQACQGAMVTTGVTRIQSDSSAGQDDLEDLMKELGGGEPEVTGPTSHEMADLLVINSTFEGYLSFRDTSVGSFFMRALVSVFRERGHEAHVMDMILEITQKLDERNIGTNDYKQVCTIKCGTLKRKVFFLPGYSEE